MIVLRLAIFIFLILSVLESGAQDSLLLTNGKIKNLKGVVVFTDHDEILYQNNRQRKRMKRYVSKKEARNKDVSPNAENNVGHLQKEEERIIKKERQEKLNRMRADFKDEVTSKMERLSDSDFEKWKNEQVAKIKAMAKERELNDAIAVQVASARINRKEARERAKFTKKVARDIVFSILKADSSEIIVYNADTLGFFADGEADREYGVEDMRMYIKGQQAGRKHKVAFDVLLGVAVGSISAGAGAYWGPSIPAGTVIFTSVFHNKIKNKARVNPSLFDSDPFRDGYERAAKRKKAWSFVKGSIAGMGFGILMWDGFVRGEGLPGPR
ncbi:hypothetical protein OAL15_00570 [Flavobacteriales bacterium]|nr:hypothetical protein [Flavobacteriales bacterium]